MKKYKTLECHCPVETLSETISTIITNRADMGCELNYCRTVYEGNYCIVYFVFTTDEDLCIDYK